jgi:hypothetical protein
LTKRRREGQRKNEQKGEELSHSANTPNEQ